MEQSINVLLPVTAPAMISAANAAVETTPITALTLGRLEQPFTVGSQDPKDPSWGTTLAVTPASAIKRLLYYGFCEGQLYSLQFKFTTIIN